MGKDTLSKPEEAKEKSVPETEAQEAPVADTTSQEGLPTRGVLDTLLPQISGEAAASDAASKGLLENVIRELVSKPDAGGGEDLLGTLSEVIAALSQKPAKAKSKKKPKKKPAAKEKTKPKKPAAAKPKTTTKPKTTAKPKTTTKPKKPTAKPMTTARTAAKKPKRSEEVGAAAA